MGLPNAMTFFPYLGKTHLTTHTEMGTTSYKWLPHHITLNTQHKHTTLNTHTHTHTHQWSYAMKHISRQKYDLSFASKTNAVGDN